MAVKDPERNKRYINGRETFYTPNELLKYKNISIDCENRLDEAEEERIVYVAMTRAADLLILSCSGNTPEKIDGMKYMLNNNINELESAVVRKKSKSGEDEKLKLNYTKYSAYNLCPYRYNLIYNLGFKVSSEKQTDLGTVFHEIMETINLKLKDNQEISDKELSEITRDTFEEMFDIDENCEEYKSLLESVRDYFNRYSKKTEVLECELQFEFERENYILNGAIDLVY